MSAIAGVSMLLAGCGKKDSSDTKNESIKETTTVKETTTFEETTSTETAPEETTVKNDALDAVDKLVKDNKIYDIEYHLEGELFDNSQIAYISGREWIISFLKMEDYLHLARASFKNSLCLIKGC